MCRPNEVRAKTAEAGLEHVYFHWIGALNAAE